MEDENEMVGSGEGDEPVVDVEPVDVEPEAEASSEASSDDLDTAEAHADPATDLDAPVDIDTFTAEPGDSFVVKDGKVVAVLKPGQGRVLNPGEEIVIP